MSYSSVAQYLEGRFNNPRLLKVIDQKAYIYLEPGQVAYIDINTGQVTMSF